MRLKFALTPTRLRTEQCAKVQFLHLDYQSKGWDNIAHVDAFCAVASDGVSVRNKIIISHGMRLCAGVWRVLSATTSVTHDLWLCAQASVAW